MTGLPVQVPQVHYARSGSYSIAYQVVGDGPDDLVFIPGFVSNVEAQWEHPVVAAFFSRLASFSRLIVFDKRGTGLSDRVPVDRTPSLEERMDDVRAVMDAVGIERANLFGISEGGPLALLFAATFPDRVERLVLANTYTHRYRVDLLEVAAEVRRQWGTGAVFAALAPSWYGTEDRRFFARYERLSATPDTAAHLVALTDDIDVRALLPTVSAPTLVAHRCGDRVIAPSNSRALAEAVPGAEFVLLDGRDHLVYVDHDQLLTAVEGFITGVGPVPEPDRAVTTIVFVDVVGSTELAERLGDVAWTDVLGHFYAKVRTELSRHRGAEITTTGDGLVATFDGPARAVRFGRALGPAVASLDLRLRVGVHTAEVERVGQDIAGLAVHVCARVAAVATPGEVWVTRTVRDLTAGSGLVFEPRGTHVLRGVSRSWELLAVQ